MILSTLPNLMKINRQFEDLYFTLEGDSSKPLFIGDLEGDLIGDCTSVAVLG